MRILVTMNSILPISQTKMLAENVKQQGQRAVLVGGCFDFLHIGHITLLEHAKKQGDILVVILESDARIQQLKGTQRPLQTQTQRAHMLMALKCVDYVILLPTATDDRTYETVVKQLQPAIIATTKGSKSLEYIEKQAKKYGAGIYTAPKIENLSTSRILKIIEQEI